MRVWVLGSDGEVGSALCGALAPRHDVVASSGDELDITDASALAAAMRSVRPNTIVNAAGYTDVDGAEHQPERAHQVNALAVGNLGQLARDHRVALLHFSTDFVFDGTRGKPYVEQDATNPSNAYGRSKLAGEQALLALDAPTIVFRTSCVYGLHRPNFVSTILRLARERELLRVVDDQVANPTFSRELAAAVAHVLDAVRADAYAGFASLRGVYHVAGQGSCSRHALALAALAVDPHRSEHVIRCVEPVPSSAYPLPARRPGDTSLDCSLAQRRLGIALPPWQESLARALGA